MSDTIKGNGSTELLADVLVDYIRLVTKSQSGDKINHIILDLQTTDGKSCKLDIDYIISSD